MGNAVLSPPIVIVLFFALAYLGSKWLSRYSTVRAGGSGLDAYACGQRNIKNYVNPNYSEFFPLAFFFTLMHVFTLVVMTAPADALLLPAVYVGAGILVLAIIFKR